VSFVEGADGVRLRFTDRGVGDPPLVLVHGWKGSHRLWDPVVSRLAEHRRVVAFDLRGMGESDKPRCAYDFEELSDDLGAVLEALGLRDIVLVAWSMGTTVSLRYLERGGAGVRALVIVNGPLRLTRAPDFPHAMTEAELAGYVRELRDSWPAGEREFQAHTLLQPVPAVVDWLYAIALQTPLDVALRLVENQAKLDMRDALTQLDIPVLAAYSTNDPYYPPSLAEYIARSARAGDHVLFERSRHCIPIEEAERFCHVVREFAA
jgi:pimeloyl-ACP methyl ester carboxylesterase